MEHFKDAHYFHIPSQGNIYTVTDLKLANGTPILLAASLKREIFCIEYLESSSGFLVSTTKEVSFTYIPSGAEIISIDAFNKSTTNNELVIGITIIKNSSDSDTLETFLNIYCQLEENEDFDIENIAQNCLNVELNFIPYKLLHTHLITWNDCSILGKEIVFVLSGSDNQVHIFQENTTDHVYREIDAKEYFPEFGKTASPVVWIDIQFINNFEERVTAFGCECGYVKLMKINTKTNKIVYNFSVRFGNYISNVYLYREDKIKSKYKIQKIIGVNNSSESAGNSQPILNMIVINSILPAVIFRDVLTYGLSDYATLPRHDNSTILTSCVVADIDFDDEKEILLGNSSEEIMLIKYDKGAKNWFLEELKLIAAPVLCIKYIDLTGDGVKDLVVFSVKGIHVLQYDHHYINEQLNKKIDSVCIPTISNTRESAI
ncbi:KICSTOR complex protein kaptin-like [Cylas formicarius]|uniref:KICSTOR complex protein kaptin-like n=1 Tax=Cylas formicarius TaxID=197179 RepID=UPI002958C8FD|nr:KICSTOR complex protein kaptin-like [Cylas formicarius]